MPEPIKIIRTSTIPGSIETFCNGLLRDLRENEGYSITVVSSPGADMRTIEQREGVRCISVPMKRHISPLNDFVSLCRLTKVFMAERPDMVHSITPKAGLLSMIAGWICRVPVRLHTFTGLVFPTAHGLKRRILILTDKITCACATHIAPEGEGVKKDLQDSRITGKPLNVLGHGNLRGIDLSHYDPKDDKVASEAEKIRKPEKFTFIFVGRIVADKGVNELVGAFEMLKRENPDIRLLLVGSYEEKLDPLDSETVGTIRDDDDIESVGQQKDVRPWLLASDALVFPSYREGFPNVVIEAGAMGLPSIVTDINGSREIIMEGENGVIVPARDSCSLHKAMKGMMEDKDKRLYMAGNARRLIADRYEQSYVRQCLKDYYRQILNKKIQ